MEITLCHTFILRITLVLCSNMFISNHNDNAFPSIAIKRKNYTALERYAILIFQFLLVKRQA